MTGRNTGFTGADYAQYSTTGILNPRFDETRREYHEKSLTALVWESISRKSGSHPADRFPYHQ